MAVNAVAPFEGVLEYVGEVNSGSNWKSVDFAIRYTDHQMNENLICFNAFGEDKVNKIINLPLGTPLKVVWWPKTNQSKSTGKCYPMNAAINISVVKGEAKPADTKITAPNFPAQGTQMPGSSFQGSEAWKNPFMETPQPNPDESDLPF